MATRKQSRHGVVLLLVLSLLVLFVLIALTFVITAGHYKQGAQAASRRETFSDDPQKELDEVFGLMMRGSARYSFDLLGDKYGGSVKGTVSGAATSEVGGQFLTFNFAPNAGYTFNATPKFYAGCVLTVITGGAAGHSTRVVDYALNGASGTVRVEAFDSDATASGIAPANGAQFIINNRAYSGTGAGYNVSSGTPVAQTLPDGTPYELAPNSFGYPSSVFATPFSYLQSLSGGTNEPRDAVDHQDIHLAGMTASPTNSAEIIPSLHRPALIQYWLAQKGDFSNTDFWRQVIFRPMPWDHPNFTGSNPAATLANAGNWLMNGPWDVDNDGDGIPDSIWMDPLMPVKSTADGRLYKRLVAYLCLDHDGRANLNAHGNMGQLTGPYTSPYTLAFAGTGDTTPLNLSRGQGMGVADINLNAVFGGYTSQLTTLMSVRNGADAVPGVAGLSYRKNRGMPADFAAYVGGSQPSLYQTPSDVYGMGFVALDHFGSPIRPLQGMSSQTVNNPYEFNLSKSATWGTGAIDAPFTLGEMEVLLRANDPDAGLLPSRLRLALGAAANDPAFRRRVTTHSYYDPSPSFSLINLLALRLGTTNSTTIVNAAKVLLPWEAQFGQRMDLNRPFGNGIDDNGNGIIDEPGEVEGTLYGAAVNVLNNDPISNSGNPYAARQIYARQLYVTMMLLIDAGYVQPPLVETLDNATQRQLLARRIAQWAINVVDFRDSDAIMTPFEYSVDPFDTANWQSIAGSPFTASAGVRGLVWGLEYPEMVLGETSAFHDRRVRDCKNDDGAEPDKRLKEGSTDMAGDTDLDQYRIPQGSLFLELISTRGPQNTVDGNPNPVLPPELYTNSGGTWFLDLRRMAPADGGGRKYPVWRVAISASQLGGTTVTTRSLQKRDTVTYQPESMSMVAGVADAVTIDRLVFFAPNGGGYCNLDSADHNRAFYNKSPAGAGAQALLATSGYAVVGPRPTTYVGSVTGGARSPQILSLNAGSFTATSTFAAYPTSGMRTPLGIVAAADAPATWTNAGTTAPNGVGVNVSEPLTSSAFYYKEPMVDLGDGITDAYANETTPDGTNKFPDVPYDTDNNRPLGQNGQNLNYTGTYPDYRTAFLQRLANPLVAYDPTSNPYITVDWMPIDLTVFNGEDKKPSGFPAVLDPWDPSDPDPYGSAPDEKFATRQRGAGTGSGNLWEQVWQNLPTTASNGSTDQYFPYALRHSLGFLNPSLLNVATPATPPAVPGRTSPAGYEGAPPRPFPWITWNNRPFASPTELMLVPATSSGRLMHEFTLSTGTNPYQTTSHRDPYGHLLNFMQGSNTADQAPNYSRIFDCVEVPSRFVGTEKWYNDNTMATAAAGTAADFLRPPFNKLSRFRDPGRVNINTIFDPQVWNAVMASTGADVGVSYADMDASRRGYAAGGYDPNYPTNFANPFRPSAFANRAPIPAMQKTGVEAGLLRAHPTNTDRPLFSSNDSNLYRDVNRNPYFYYENLLKVSNKVGFTSEVYSLWVTVGYFEVTPTTPSTAYPDGYILGQELGSDTGEFTRHKGFYIIDRSIPVGYERGENHNIDRAVPIRRLLQ